MDVGVFFETRMTHSSLTSLHLQFLHSAFRIPHSSFRKEPVAFLDVEVNPIASDVGHIINKVVSKNASKIRNFSEMQGCEALFYLIWPKKCNFPSVHQFPVNSQLNNCKLRKNPKTLTFPIFFVPLHRQIMHILYVNRTKSIK